MSLKERLLQELKQAMKEKNKLWKNTITMLRSDVKNWEIDHHSEATDEDILTILSKQIKTKQKAIQDFQKGGREDLVSETQKEIAYLQRYLPEQISDSELEKEVESILHQCQAKSMKDMGKVMSIAKSRLSHRVDMQKLSATIKEKLS